MLNEVKHPADHGSQRHLPSSCAKLSFRMQIIGAVGFGPGTKGGSDRAGENVLHLIARIHGESAHKPSDDLQSTKQ
jgi:hypothetical protein